MNPVHRAARALAENHALVSDGYYTLAARAVLRAIRDFDLDTQDDSEIDILMAGRAVLPEHDEPTQEDALNCWRAMIDEMLRVEAPCPPAPPGRV